MAAVVAGDLAEKLGASRAASLATLAKTRNVDVGRYGSIVTSPKSPKSRRLTGPGVYRPPAGSDPGGSIPGPESRVARAARGVGNAASSAGDNVGDALTGESPTSIATKLILAIGAALIVLEVGSQLSGQYFHYDLAAVGKLPAKARQHYDLYKGQTADLAALHAAAGGIGAGPVPLPGALVPAAATSLYPDGQPSRHWQ